MTFIGNDPIAPAVHARFGADACAPPGDDPAAAGHAAGAPASPAVATPFEVAAASAACDEAALAPALAGIALHQAGQHEAAERAYRRALEQSPDDPTVWSNLGLALQAQRRFGEAEACQQHALRLAPTYPDAHNNLGLTQYEQGRVAEAENSFHGALRLQPDHPNALTNLGIALQSLNQLAAAEACYRQALLAGAEPARVLNNLGLVLQELGRPQDAEDACRAALALGEQPDARTNLALVLLQRGAYEEAWPAYEARWRTAGMAGDVRRFDCPQWAGDPLEGRTILLHAEQGYGDTLQFCRYAPLVAEMGARVVLEAPPALCRLLGSLAGVAAVIPTGASLPQVDLHCPLMSLPLACRTTSATIPAGVPYLHAEAAAAAAWRGPLSALPGRRVGLVWAGSARLDQPHARAIDRRRSIPLEALAPLAAATDCSFVSLQLGAPAAQTPPAGLRLFRPADLDDFADTAAVIEALDLVVAVDTAVAHLAGALGKPVWLLNRFDSCWRWGSGGVDNAWYPTLRQFRQPRAGDWATPIAQVAAALARFTPDAG